MELNKCQVVIHPAWGRGVFIEYTQQRNLLIRFEGGEKILSRNYTHLLTVTEETAELPEELPEELYDNEATLPLGKEEPDQPEVEVEEEESDEADGVLLEVGQKEEL